MIDRKEQATSATRRFERRAEKRKQLKEERQVAERKLREGLDKFHKGK